jgi:hypothetical protein
MREECRHFQSRSYNSGEVARFCALDLAPDAPWRCPDDCPAYEKRLADAGWVHGSLVEPPLEEEPSPPSEGSLHLLDEAEDIVNIAGPAIVSEIEDQRRHEEARRGRLRWPWRRSR